MPKISENDIQNASIQTKIKLDQKVWFEHQARPKQQIPEGNWLVWLIMAGRGWGKNRTAAEAVRYFVESRESKKLLLVSKNPRDARQDMIEDPDSGLLACCSDFYTPEWEPGNRRLIWPDGQIAHVRVGTKPDNIRGGGYDLVWMDELSAWDYPKDTYDQIQFACRKANPKQIITMTPKPIDVVKEIKKESIEEGTAVLTSGHTEENRDNLSADWWERIVNRYEGTRLGEQELKGEILSNAQGLVYSMFDESTHVVSELPEPGEFITFWIGIDYGTSNPTHFSLVGWATNHEFYLIDEWRHSGRQTGRAMTDADYSEALDNWINDLRDKHPTFIPKWIFIDPTASSFKAQLRRDGVQRLTDADNTVVDGIRRTQSLFSTENFYVHEDCRHTIRELNSYMWQQAATDRGEDKPLKEADHAMDALRYVINSVSKEYQATMRGKGKH